MENRCESDSRSPSKADDFGVQPDSARFVVREGDPTLEQSCEECDKPLIRENVVEGSSVPMDLWDWENFEYFEDTWNNVFVFHQLGTEEIPKNYISFYYDDDGNYREAGPEDLEWNDDEEDYDDYSVWDKNVLEDEVQTRAGALLASWVSIKEAGGEWPSDEQKDEQTNILTAELRNTLQINIFGHSERPETEAFLGCRHLQSKAKGKGKPKGRGKTRTPSQFKPLPKGQGMNHASMSKGAGHVIDRPGKGYGTAHKDCTRFYDDIKGCRSLDGGATFRDRPLRDPTGKYYPIDKADQYQSNPDHLNEASVDDDTLEHSRGFLKAHLWTHIAP